MNSKQRMDGFDVRAVLITALVVLAITAITAGLVVGITLGNQAKGERWQACLDAGNTPSACAVADNSR